MVGIVSKANEDRAMVGIAMVLLANLGFSGIDASAKWLAIAGLPAFQIAFMRYLGHFLISTALIAKGGISRDRFSTERFGLVILRGVLLMTSTALNFFALRYLPLTLTGTIMFLQPILVCALSGPFLGERVGPWRWGAIVIGFVGVVVAIRPFEADFHWAVFLSLTNTVCIAGYILLTRKLAGVVASDTMQFYGALVGTVCLAPLAFLVWQTPTTGLDFAVMIFIGVFGWAGHQLLTNAHSYATASALTPFNYVFLVYLTIWSVLVFGEWPDGWTLVGAAIVIAAGLVIWFRERRVDKIKRVTPHH